MCFCFAPASIKWPLEALLSLEFSFRRPVNVQLVFFIWRQAILFHFWSCFWWLCPDCEKPQTGRFLWELPTCTCATAKREALHALRKTFSLGYQVTIFFASVRKVARDLDVFGPLFVVLSNGHYFSLCMHDGKRERKTGNIPRSTPFNGQ